MGTVDPRWASLARRLVDHEAAAGGNAAALADAAEQTCQRLQTCLSPLIGPEGFRIMLGNAVDITRSEHSFLQAIDSRAGPNGCFPRLGEALAGRTHEQARAAVLHVIAEFLGLLASFLGDALTLRLVRGAWPEIDWETEATRPESTQP